jgi:hypothetical protein
MLNGDWMLPHKSIHGGSVQERLLEIPRSGNAALRIKVFFVNIYSAFFIQVTKLINKNNFKIISNYFHNRLSKTKKLV